MSSFLIQKIWSSQSPRNAFNDASRQATSRSFAAPDSENKGAHKRNDQIGKFSTSVSHRFDARSFSRKALAA